SPRGGRHGHRVANDAAGMAAIHRSGDQLRTGGCTGTLHLPTASQRIAGESGGAQRARSRGGAGALCATWRRMRTIWVLVATTFVGCIAASSTSGAPEVGPVATDPAEGGPGHDSGTLDTVPDVR